MSTRHIRLLLLGIAALSLGVAGSAESATITVNDLRDLPVNLSDSVITLRDAIHAANNDLQVEPGGPTGNGPDIIVFDAMLTLSASQTIKLSVFDPGLQNGEFGPTAFKITSRITIIGPSGDYGISLKRVAPEPFRLFDVAAPNGDLTLEYLTLTGGVAQGGNSRPGAAAGGGGGAGIGGAILNDNTLTIQRCTLTDNEAIGGAGSAGSATNVSGGGAGGGGAGGDSAGTAANAQQFRTGGDPNGGDTNGENGGLGGGGAGGSGVNGGADPVGFGGGDGGAFGGGGGGGGASDTGATSATGGQGGDGGFGGGGGGGGPARSTGNPEASGDGGAGGGGAGDGSAGVAGAGAKGGSGGGGGGMGGAIFNRGGTIDISNSTFSDNQAIGGNSGGIAANGDSGGALGNGGAGDGRGAAIFNRNGLMTIISCTISGNHIAAGSTNGGAAGLAAAAVFNLGDGATATMVVTNSILANTTGGGNFDFVGTTNNGGTNSNSGSGDLIEKNNNFSGSVVVTDPPLLQGLANNRGPTQTHALQANSPAIDGGNDAAASGLITDQRGGLFLRIADGDLLGLAHVDIGAFERVQVDYGDAPDFIQGTGPTSTLLENGDDDFRISKMGNDVETDPQLRANFGATGPAMAYNATNNEFLIVWYGDDDSAPLVDNELEIFAQRVDASTGAVLGGRIRISEMGPDGDPDFDAILPAVAWNGRDNSYLVVWRGEDSTPPLVDGELEIFGRIVTGSGATPAPQFRISTMGNDAETDPALRRLFAASDPSVTYNSTTNEYLVVWQSNDDTPPQIDRGIEIFAQRLKAATGELTGTRVRVSRMGPAGNAAFLAARPEVSWNRVNNSYLVVWYGDDDTPPLVLEEFEIFGTILDGTLGQLVPQFRISTMGPDGDKNFQAAQPALAYNPTRNEYLVVWQGEDNSGLLVDGEFEIYGQVVNAQFGAKVGSPLRISQMGIDGDVDSLAFLPRVDYSADTGSYLVVWIGSEDVDEYEVYGRRVNGPGTSMGPNQIRLSTMGPDGDPAYQAETCSVAFGSLSDEYLVVWQGDDNTIPLVDGEYEIHGQRVSDVGIVDYSTRGADLGPAHRIRPGIRIGATVDSEINGRSSINADADDLSGSDDEDGAAAQMTLLPSDAPALDVTVTNNVGDPATLYGWVDYNGDGVFDNSTERASVPVPNGTNDAVVTLDFPLHSGPVVSPTLVRLRLSTDSIAQYPMGLAVDGEVEDYRMSVPTRTVPSVSRAWLAAVLLAAAGAAMMFRRRRA